MWSRYFALREKVTPRPKKYRLAQGDEVRDHRKRSSITRINIERMAAQRLAAAASTNM